MWYYCFLRDLGTAQLELAQNVMMFLCHITSCQGTAPGEELISMQANDSVYTFQSFLVHSSSQWALNGVSLQQVVTVAQRR